MTLDDIADKIPRKYVTIHSGWSMSASPTFCREYEEAPLKQQLSNIRYDIKIFYIQP